jgi:hypothetical protein
MYLILMVKILFFLEILLSFFYSDNKQLDRKEYNLWTIRTTNQEINDEDWSSIRGKILIGFSKKNKSFNFFYEFRKCSFGC